MSVFACSGGAGGPVASVIRVAVPSGTARSEVLARFEDAAPAFREVPGLLRKYFVVEEDGPAGGIYLWESRAAATAYLDDAWRKRVSDRFGNEPDVSFYDAPVFARGRTARGANADAVATIVRVTPPWYAFRPLVVRRFRSAVPTYESIAGLVYKYFTIDESGKIGGIYLWQNREAASAFYDDAWHERIRQTYGEDGELETFDAPIVVANREP